MSNLHHNTEEQIKEKAKEYFFVQGHFAATNMEVADFVGVKRTLLNYYFRSKENLLHTVWAEIIQDMKHQLDLIYAAEVSFEEKLDQLITFSMDFKIKYPFFEIYKTYEVGQRMQNKASIVQPVPTPSMKQFLNEIETEMDKGTIQKAHPYNFLLNLYSLLTYPVVMRPIFRDLYELSDEEYNYVIEDRKSLIKNLLYKK